MDSSSPLHGHSCIVYSYIYIYIWIYAYLQSLKNKGKGYIRNQCNSSNIKTSFLGISFKTFPSPNQSSQIMVCLTFSLYYWWLGLSTFSLVKGSALRLDPDVQVWHDLLDYRESIHHNIWLGYGFLFTNATEKLFPVTNTHWVSN